MKRTAFAAGFLAVLLYASTASAGVWFELLHAPCLTGEEADIEENNGFMGEYKGALDCFNKDFNGGGARTLLSIKAFQPWDYGFMFLYYDITGPFNSAAADVESDNEKGGFFGGTTVGLSVKKIGEKFAGRQFDWGMLADLAVKYEIEHVSKFGALHYIGLNWDFKVPHMDFVSATTVIRQDRSLKGIDLQLGGAWQKSFSLLSQDFIFGGFFQWGLFGEGEHIQPAVAEEGVKGNWFFLSQPQLLWDFGKAVSFKPAKLYVGFEYQLALNRYLIQDKTENTLQGMIRWNL